jgi:MoaA/NifB/PqqE/SkfB family radical SAM enzyme
MMEVESRMLAPFRRVLRRANRRMRMTRVIARAFTTPFAPTLAQIVPIRRCNLSCAYCNEFDKTSEPVPLDVMLRRIDDLARLGTQMVELSGGEPLLHPQLEAIVRRIRERGMVAGLLTNGFLLTPARIDSLNRAGLDRLQISIDNVKPDAVSHKSLKTLDRALRWLAEYAEFDVNINTVLGASVEHPEDALAIARRALALGFGTSVGLIHDASGQTLPLKTRQRRVYEDIRALDQRFWSHAHDGVFQDNLIDGRPNAWHCRAGARYLYVCEDGLVHWCSQQRGYPGSPLAQYGIENIRREHASVKSCAPACTISCVHRVSLLDDLREHPLPTLERLLASDRVPRPRVPVGVRVLVWLFVTGRPRAFFRRAVARAMNAR